MYIYLYFLVFDEDEDKYVQYSNHYGLAHFLRVFTRFSETLQFTHYKSDKLDLALRYAQDFVIFLGDHYSDFYDKNEDYYPASQEYIDEFNSKNTDKE